MMEYIFPDTFPNGFAFNYGFTDDFTYSQRLYLQLWLYWQLYPSNGFADAFPYLLQS